MQYFKKHGKKQTLFRDTKIATVARIARTARVTLYGMITHSNTCVDAIRIARIPNGKSFIVMTLLRPHARPRLSLGDAAALSAALRRLIGSSITGLPTRLPIAVTVNQGSIEFAFPPRHRVVGTSAMWAAFCDEIDHAIATVRPN